MNVRWVHLISRSSFKRQRRPYFVRASASEPRGTYQKWYRTSSSHLQTHLEMDTLAIGDSFEATVPDKRHADMKIYIAAYRRGIKISIKRTSPNSVRVARIK